MENRNIDRLIEIASLLKSKDLSCFDEFYEYTKTKTYNIIYALVRNQTITEDLLQDTYVKFLNNLESLKEDVNPVGYLTTIARNTALDYLKRNHREVYVDAYDNVDIYGGENDKYNLDINVFKIAKQIVKTHQTAIRTCTRLRCLFNCCLLITYFHPFQREASYRFLRILAYLTGQTC